MPAAGDVYANRHMDIMWGQGAVDSFSGHPLHALVGAGVLRAAYAVFATSLASHWASRTYMASVPTPKQEELSAWVSLFGWNVSCRYQGEWLRRNRRFTTHWGGQ